MGRNLQPTPQTGSPAVLDEGVGPGAVVVPLRVVELNDGAAAAPQPPEDLWGRGGAWGGGLEGAQGGW